MYDEQRERATKMARKYWRSSFGSDQIFELVIDFMVAFARNEHLREFAKEHGMDQLGDSTNA